LCGQEVQAPPIAARQSRARLKKIGLVPGSGAGDRDQIFPPAYLRCRGECGQEEGAGAGAGVAPHAARAGQDPPGAARVGYRGAVELEHEWGLGLRAGHVLCGGVAPPQAGGVQGEAQ
jgi:hypothetical protein